VSVLSGIDFVNHHWYIVILHKFFSMKTIYKSTTVFLLLNFFFISSPINAQGLEALQITGFKAESRNGNVGITWKTDNEANLREYEIESSPDGRYFRNLGFIPARNNINGDFYEFENAVDYADSVFYRLKIVDANGKWLHTKPVLYRINKTTSFFVYPSVINVSGSNTINVFIDDPFDFIEVINMSGAVLLKQNLSGKTGKISIPMSPDISAGTYVVQLKNEERTITQKIVIQ
jgi:type IX secretion system substrate protein